MAVDIYGYAEVRTNGRWIFPGIMVPNPEREYDPDEPELMPEQVFHSNHKELAAILIDTGRPIRSSEPYVPIVSRRGLPPDLSRELSKWLKRYEDDTSFQATWFSAVEAADFGWNERIMRRRAFVPPAAAPLFAGCPRGFPFAKWPNGIPISYSSWSRDGVEVEWLETYAEIVPEFSRGVLPHLAKFGPPDQVRIVVAAAW